LTESLVVDWPPLLALTHTSQRLMLLGHQLTRKESFKLSCRYYLYRLGQWRCVRLLAPRLIQADIHEEILQLAVFTATSYRDETIAD
jgi:hypothetical protein